MNNRPLQPGDLCLIVGAKKNRSNIGKSCRLVEFVKYGNFCIKGRIEHYAGDSPAWVVEGDGLDLLKVSGRLVIGAGYCHVLPCHLMRIDGNPDAEKETVGEEEEIEA